MRFDQHFLDEIRDRLPVSQVVSRRVQLKRQGREFIGLSPFKQEKTPSFTVNDAKGFYHCFATGEHGDIFKFVQAMEGLSFPEAVERLAREAGLEMPKVSPRAQERERGRDRLREAVDVACAFFEAGLQDIKGGPARAYLDRRGMSLETREAFRIGYARADRHALKEHLAGKGFTPKEMADAGLVISGDDIPVSYDRFRDRIIFPITDLKGRVIAFGGRALSADAPAKYLNSPETPLFHKGGVLFNAHGAREAAYKAGSVIVAEGYMDVIALAQAGFANAVAPLGTALTEDQMKLLWRFGPEPVLCFDGDGAGRKAAFRAVDTALPLLEPGHSLRFVFLPDGLDPDDLIAAQGPQAFAALLDRAQPLISVLWMRETEAGDFSTPERRAALEKRLHDLLRQIPDKRVRRHYGEEVAARLRKLWQGPSSPAPGPRAGFRPRDGFAKRPWNGGRGRGRGGFEPSVSQLGASESLKSSPLVRGASQARYREALLLRTLLNHPWLLERHAELISALSFRDPLFAGLRDEMLNLQAGDKDLDSEAFHTQLSRYDNGAALEQVARAITHKSDWFAEPGASRSDVETGWRQIVALHRRSVELERELAAAERAFQAEESEQALARLYDIRRQLSNLEGTEAVIEGYGAGSGR